MIADLKPYPAMKPSGVPWLGEVPAHAGGRCGAWEPLFWDGSSRATAETNWTKCRTVYRVLGTVICTRNTST